MKKHWVVFWLRVQWALERADRWIMDHQPVVCAWCGNVIAHKDARAVRTLWNVEAWLCDGCYQAEYKPFWQK